MVFGKLVEALVFGAGYERLADASCSATTMRRRRDDWIRLGVWERLKLACLDAYDKTIGLDLADLAVDGCTTKAPCGGDCAGRSPVDRAKGGMKRSQLTDGAGVPIATVSAPANTVDHALLAQTLDALKTSNRCPSTSPCIWTPAMTTAPAGKHSRKGAGRRDRPPRHPGADPGRQTVGRRANQLLTQRLRQAATLHRTAERLPRRLPRPGCRHRHYPRPSAGRLVPLPLGHTTKITTHPLTYWRRLLARIFRPAADDHGDATRWAAGV